MEIRDSFHTLISSTDRSTCGSLIVVMNPMHKTVEARGIHGTCWIFADTLYNRVRSLNREVRWVNIVNLPTFLGLWLEVILFVQNFLHSLALLSWDLCTLICATISEEYKPLVIKHVLRIYTRRKRRWVIFSLEWMLSASLPTMLLRSQKLKFRFSACLEYTCSLAWETFDTNEPSSRVTIHHIAWTRGHGANLDHLIHCLQDPGAIWALHALIHLSEH